VTPPEVVAHDRKSPHACEGRSNSSSSAQLCDSPHCMFLIRPSLLGAIFVRADRHDSFHRWPIRASPNRRCASYRARYETAHVWHYNFISSAPRRAAYIHSFLVGPASLTFLAHSKPPVEIADQGNGDLKAGYSCGRRGNHVFHSAICAVGHSEYRCTFEYGRASDSGVHCAVLLEGGRVSFTL
jgi:hypothetical protein